MQQAVGVLWIHSLGESYMTPPSSIPKAMEAIRDAEKSRIENNSGFAGEEIGNVCFGIDIGFNACYSTLLKLGPEFDEKALGAEFYSWKNNADNMRLGRLAIATHFAHFQHQLLAPALAARDQRIKELEAELAKFKRPMSPEEAHYARIFGGVIALTNQALAPRDEKEEG